MKKLFVLALVLTILLTLSGCASSYLITNNTTLLDCQLLPGETKLVGKSTLYYINVQKGENKYTLEVSSAEYGALEDLYKASKALDHLDELKVDVIMDAVNNDTYGIALSRNRK